MSPSIYQIACYLGAIKLLKYDRFIVSEVTLSTIAYAVSINRLMWRVFGEVLRARHQTGTPGEVRLFWYRKSTRGRNRSRHDLYNPPMLRGDDGLDTPLNSRRAAPRETAPASAGMSPCRWFAPTQPAVPLPGHGDLQPQLLPPQQPACAFSPEQRTRDHP